MTSEEIVAQVNNEIKDYIRSNVIGYQVMNDHALTQAVDYATKLMQKNLPGYTVTAINPRIEGTAIVWDGWMLESKELQR